MSNEPTGAADTVRLDRSVPLLVAAGVLVVAVVALVLSVGIEHPPEVDALLADGRVTPPGSVAWYDHEAGDGCLRVADPDGGVREVTCGLDGEPVGWTDEGILVRRWDRGGDQLTAVDPVTGQRAPASRSLPAVPRFGSPWTEREDGRLRVSVQFADDEEERLVWEVEAPQAYEVVTSSVSPDGSMVALGDNADRLLVVPADASSAPLLWSDDFPGHVALVWEGTEPAGVDD